MSTDVVQKSKDRVDIILEMFEKGDASKFNIGLYKQASKNVGDKEKDEEYVLDKEIENVMNQFVEKFGLNKEQIGKLSNVTGREKLGMIGMLMAFGNAGQSLHTKFTGNTNVNLSGLFSKFIAKPAALAALGNIIYNGIKDFEDGATTKEIASFVFQLTLSISSGVQIVLSFIQAKYGVDVEGIPNDASLFKKLKHYFFESQVIKPEDFSIEGGKVNTPDTPDSGKINTPDTPDSGKINIPDTPDSGKVNTPDAPNSGKINVPDAPNGGVVNTPDIPNSGKVNMPDAPSGGVANTPDIPNSGKVNIPDAPNGGVVNTPDVPNVSKSGKAAKGAGVAIAGLGLIVDLTWLTTASIDLAETSKENIMPSQICNVVGASLGLTGDFIATVGGPVGAIVGTVISGIGSGIAALGPLFDLTKKEVTPKEVHNAVERFMMSFTMLPSPESIMNAENMRKLRDNANNDIDREIFSQSYKILALNSTPVINFFSFIYDKDLRNRLKNTLMERYSNFNNLMSVYYSSNEKLMNSLEDIKNKLEKNNDIGYSEIVTLFTTPQHIKNALKDVNGVTHEIIFRYKSDHFYIPGMENVGKQVQTGYGIDKFDSRGVYNLSLGDGKGKEFITNEKGERVKNTKRIDTATMLTYGKEQLKNIKDGFKDKDININLKDDVSRKNNKIINNRVIATISDGIKTNINLGDGNDELIVGNVERIYPEKDSKVSLSSDGGEGEDTLNLMNTSDFEAKYTEIFNGLIGGLESDYEINLQGYEKIILSKGTNNITSQPFQFQDEEFKPINFIAPKESHNNINFQGITKTSLYFQSLSDYNTVKGTEKGDYINIKSQNVDYNEVHGYGGNDIISGVTSGYGGEGTDYIVGTGDFCQLYGENGNDILVGSGDSSILEGGNGKDALYSGSGDDILKGGQDLDVYVFNKDFGTDIIKDDSISNIVFNDISLGDIWIEKGNDSLTISEGGNEIYIDNWFQNNNKDITIQFVKDGIVNDTINGDDITASSGRLYDLLGRQSI